MTTLLEQSQKTDRYALGENEFWPDNLGWVEKEQRFQVSLLATGIEQVNCVKCDARIFRDIGERRNICDWCIHDLNASEKYYFYNFGYLKI